jgi:hypothetical protein
MKKILFSFFIISLIFSSCGKIFEGPAGDKGDTGAAGRDGTNGIDGTDGRNGIDGTDGRNGTDGRDGKDGNANVIASSNYTPTWSISGKEYINSSSAPFITQSIVDKGAVMVYMKSGSSWIALPATGIRYYNEVFSYTFNLNNITLYCYNVDGVALPSPSPSGSVFRIVAISASNLERYPDTDWKNYEQTAKILNLNS